MNLTNKTAIVTGGSEGLGLAITKMLVNEGANVHIFSRNSNTQEKIREEINSEKLTTHIVDISSFSQITKALESIQSVDILINNAGVWLDGKLESNDPEKISQVLDINLKGTIFMARAVLPLMIEKNEGHILNISSTSGLIGRESQAVYAASKFGVRGFTDSLKTDLKSSNIKVSGFYPGGMSTKLFEKAGDMKDNSNWMNTDKVANVVKFILEQDDTMILDHVVLNRRG